jgi:GT2 family glycosyltransferase
MIHGVYICTKNREEDVLRLLHTVSRNFLDSFSLRVLIGDSTEPIERFKRFGERIRLEFPEMNIEHFYHLGGLPSARNACLGKLSNEDVIHFFDDDVTIPDNYFRAIESFMFNYPDCYGGGPRVADLYKNELSGKYAPLRKLLGLTKKYGQITRAGRHYWVPDIESPSLEVAWIPGCSMFFKAEVFRENRFNGSMENGPGRNYALGEDLEFSHRVSKAFKLRSVGNVKVTHHQAPSKRDNWSLIARASGAQYAYLLRRFPEELNPFKIHFGRFIDFIIMNRPLKVLGLKEALNLYFSYYREFRREKREQLIKFS